MSFFREIRVRFQHCDPAGIVFYPRYFEMLNEVIEDWFEERAGLGFHAMHTELGIGVPAVRIDCEFLAASRIGDRLRFEVGPIEAGRRSMAFAVEAKCGEEARLRAKMVLVCVSLGDPLASREIPPALRAAIAPDP